MDKNIATCRELDKDIATCRGLDKDIATCRELDKNIATCLAQTNHPVDKNTHTGKYVTSNLRAGKKSKRAAELKKGTGPVASNLDFVLSTGLSGKRITDALSSAVVKHVVW